MTDHQRIVIFLGDVDEYLAIRAKQHDSSAWLLCTDSLTRFMSLKSGATVYTSLGDLPNDQMLLLEIFTKADVIFYCPPIIWSDKKQIDPVEPGNSIQGLTECLLMLLPRSVEILGSPLFCLADHDPTVLADCRKTSDPQLWVAGCSISHGDGVEIDERYGTLLAADLKLECSFLTLTGSCISWAADQILLSDLHAGDTVVWGITNVERCTTTVNQTVKISNINLQNIYQTEYLWSEDLLYRHLHSVPQVINFCDKINVNLFLVGILESRALLSFLRQQKIIYIFRMITLTRTAFSPTDSKILVPTKIILAPNNILSIKKSF